MLNITMFALQGGCGASNTELGTAFAGAGFFIGDAAGVGKGRQVAGIVLDNYARCRTFFGWGQSLCM